MDVIALYKYGYAAVATLGTAVSDRQIDLNNKNLEFIIKNIERSYEKILKFTRDIDDISLSTGKSININLIKKVLYNE